MITKKVTLDKRGFVVQGQCLPTTDGWVLLELDTDTRVEVILHEGFYDHCRSIQLRLESGDLGEIEAYVQSINNEADTRRLNSSSFFKKLTTKRRDKRST